MTPNMPRVSIGLPVYNAEASLGEAIDSLLAQTMSDFELIISDNASTDRTADIARDYARRDGRIRYVRQTRNIGAVSNFSAVLREARGEYFMWAAADDQYAPSHLDDVVRELDGHPEAVAAMSATARRYADGRLLDEVRYEGASDPNRLSPLALGLRMATGVQYHLFIYGLFRRDFLAAASGSILAVRNADRLFIWRIALGHRLRYTHKTTYFRQVSDMPARIRYRTSDPSLAKLYGSDAGYLWTVLRAFPYLLLAPRASLGVRAAVPLMILRYIKFLAGSVKADRRASESSTRKLMSIWDSLKSLVRTFPALDSRLLLAQRRRMARTGYPDWPAILAADLPEPILEAGQRAKVLIATSIGSHLSAMQLETTLAASLGLRGAQVEALLCDEVLPGCQMAEPRFFPNVRRFAEHGPKRDLCGHCYSAGRRVYESLGIKVHDYSDTLTEDERAFAQATAGSVAVTDIENFELDGLRLGEHAKAGALRFYARATIDDEPYAEQVLRRYLEAAILTAFSVRRLIERENYDVAVFHHGIYVPQGIIGEVARSMGVRVVNWNPAYRRNCFIFSHEDTYHHTLMDEPASTWETMPWDDERRERISSYLRSRWQGDNDWIRFTGDPMFEKDRILKEIGCDPDRPIIACLTNVMWDAQLHYPANAFRNMLEWLVFTIRYFETRPDLQLVIRVHPAEIRGAVPTRQPVVEEIARLFPNLPPNVFVVGPESEISTYVLAELADSAIIYGTKTGVELTAMGIPVIVAGEAWIRGKGLTRDASSVGDYRAALSALPLGRRLDSWTVERALKYAYHFFFRRMVPLRCVREGPGWPPFEFSGGSLAVLREGADPGLDCICDGILLKTPFVYDGPDHA